METLWPERGYFGLLGNAQILVYYPSISYQRIKVYRVEKWIWEYYYGAMVSVKNTTLVSMAVFIVWDKIVW